MARGKMIRTAIVADDDRLRELEEKYKDTPPPTTRNWRAENSPMSKAGLIVTEEDRMFVSQIVAECQEAANMPKVKDDVELQDRVNDYFNRCVNRGILPTVEEMWMYTGYGESWVADIISGRRRGFTPETANILKKARNRMKMIDAKMVESGKLNFLTYCFRAKNYYGMTDKSEITVTPSETRQDEYDPEEIKRRYLQAKNPVQTEFIDD